MTVRAHAFFEHGKSVEALRAWGAELGGKYELSPSEALFRDHESAVLRLDLGVLFVGRRLAHISGIRWSTFHQSLSERSKWLARVTEISSESAMLISGEVSESWLEAQDFGFDFATLVRRCTESLDDPSPWPIRAGSDPVGAWYLLPAGEVKKFRSTKGSANVGVRSVLKSFFKSRED